MISIVAATEQDIPKILEIEREAISPPWTHGALLSEMYREDSFFVVAVCEFGIDNEGTCGESSSQLLGFVILRRMGDEGELLQIAVDKTARRRGVADALMESALGFSSEHSLKSVFLEVRVSNEAAIALYTKHCFQTVRRRHDYYTNPVEDAVIMATSF